MKSIIFNTEMVKAILDGRKTQTRRVINYGLYIDYTDTMNEHSIEFAKNYCDLDDCMKDTKETFIKYHGKYKIDDILYVKETFQFGDNIRNIQNIPLNEDIEVLYYEHEINNHNSNHRDFAKIIKWKPSIYMPKKHARIFLKVTNVGVERLQDISDEDCIKEGIVEVTKDNQVFKFCIYDKKDYSSTPWQDMPKNPQEVYKKLWNSTAKDGYKWEDNPYVFVYEFERIEKQ